jgi:DNA polymerase III subunit beta
MTTTTKNQIKFTVKNLKEFDTDLNRVANQVAKTHANPVMNGIHLQAKDHGLVLTATDGTNTLKVARSEILESSEPVSIVVPKLFAEIVRKLPNANEIELCLDDLKLEITSGKSHFSLCVLDGSEFPPYTHQALDHQFRVNGQAFASALKKVVYAVATSETRPVLTAVQLMGKGDTLQFIATDSHRLSFTSIPLDDSVEAFQNVLVTGTSVAEIIKLCEGIEGEVEVEFSDQQLRVTGDTTTSARDC